MSRTPRTDAAKVIRSRINGPPNSGADMGAEGFDEIVTVAFAEMLELEIKSERDRVFKLCSEVALGATSGRDAANRIILESLKP